MIKDYINFQKKLTFHNSEIEKPIIFISLFILLIISVIINFNSRNYEKNIWEDNPSVFMSEGQPLLRSGDPAYFVNIAKYLKENIPVSEYYKKLYFPLEFEDEVSPPLLSVMISYLAKDSSLEEIVRASNKLVLLSSILSCIGIFFLFYAIGRPFEGVVASLGGGISTNFLFRSSIGYIDTDILNLFFMYVLFAFIYLSSKNQSLNKNYILIFIAGIVGKIFYLWYPKPEIILMSLFSLIFFTSIYKNNWKITITNLCIYMILTGPSIYLNSFNIFINNPYLGEYLSANVNTIDLIEKTSLNFNNIFRYIAEQTKPSFVEVFKLEGSIYLGLISFMGLFLWAFTYPILFMGLAPISLFFVLSLVLGNRALFYSGPFIWFGAVYFINFIFFKYISIKKISINKNYIYILTSLCLFFLAVLSTKVFTRDISPTYIPNKVVKSMINLNDVVEDKNNSVVVAPWTYGYQSLLYNDIPILIHPGIPTSPRHYFISRAYTAHSLEETTKILNYIIKGNIETISQRGIDTFQKLSKDLYSAKIENKNVYLMLTQQQRKWMQLEAAVGYWDIENNKPHTFNGEKAIDIFNIMEINCEDLDVQTFTTMCADSEGSIEYTIPVNLALGLFDGKPDLKRVVQVTDGLLEINLEYENSEGNTVFQIIKNSKDDTSQLYLMHEAVFRSTYNKLFHLNDNEGYELVYDEYPDVKIYKIN